MQRKLGNAWLITIITNTFEKVQCVVRENIHTPTTELEIPRGEGGGEGVRGPGNSRGEGVGR